MMMIVVLVLVVVTMIGILFLKNVLKNDFINRNEL